MDRHGSPWIAMDRHGSLLVAVIVATIVTTWSSGGPTPAGDEHRGALP